MTDVSTLAPAIRAEDIALSFRDGRGGRTPVLDVPVFDLPPGQRLVLTGPSGAGKSTLLNVLSGLIRPDRGRVLWDGEDLTRAPGRRRDRLRRERIGFVFQAFHLIGELSPLDNVLLPLSFDRLAAGRAARDRALGLLDRLGAPNRRAAAQLSRGEQQRVALARALIRDPAVIFADEPTANLDRGAGRTVIDTLAGLSAEGRTVLIVSHDPAVIEALGPARTLLRGRLEDGAYAAEDRP